MSFSRRWQGREWRTILREAHENKHSIDFLSQLIDELAGFEKYIGLMIRVFERKPTRDQTTVRRLKALRVIIKQQVRLTYNSRVVYERRLEAFEHQFGALDVKPTPPLTDLALSFEYLREQFSDDQIFEELIDE